MERRTTAERIAATKARLESEDNVWIATASSAGNPHLVPLSLAWDGKAILVTTPTGSPTVRNIIATGRARAALDDADDVAIISATAEAIPLTEVAPEVVESLVSRIGWDPRETSGDWSLIVLSPEMIHAWNSEPEIEGRTIMRNGEWRTGR
jgi:general stress protein 26